MMKKILALCMVLLLIFAMVACSEDTPEGDDALKLNYFVTYNGARLDVGVEVKDVIGKLGEYKSEDGEACGTNEKDVIYTLSGIEIETHISGESEIIRQIKITDDSQTTAEGITIGATKDEVIAAYGKTYTEGSSGALRYEGDASAIEFHFGSSGNVSNIYIKRK